MAIINESNFQFFVEEDIAIFIGLAVSFSSYKQLEARINRIAIEKCIKPVQIFVEFRKKEKLTSFFLYEKIKIDYPDLSKLNDLKHLDIKDVLIWIV